MTVTTADVRDKPGLQAADLLAWASNRAYTAKRVVAGLHLELVMKQIIPATWVLLDEAKLRIEYNRGMGRYDI